MLLTDQHHLVVRKRFRPIVDQYDVLAQPSGDPVAFAQKSRVSPEVTVYRDDGRRDAQFSVRARSEYAPISGLAVTDRDGAAIGLVRAEQPWGRRVWYVERAGHAPVRGRERSGVGAFFGALFGWVPARFDFTAAGEPVFTVRRRFGPRRRFAVRIVDDGLDRRLAVALAVALDVF
ncbi:MAG: hypothetical protein GEV28_10195 [Actinophytocola sp.]|uniref:hypothetical protein n=1 Tax=Actinophytocola sp. TaxID=1872138 RepID=UPI00132A165B|nr:hypothetical protein [Actinophytocola sp.]MPZ80735.1 hypothetical protein [Actinophytocola sp.]